MTIKVFLDCEFTGFEQAKLVSIGLVTDNGQHSFYAELTDTYSRDDCSDFVKETVLPLLEATLLSLPLNGYSNVHAQMSFSQCSEHLKRWINYLDDKVTIYNDAPDYDFTFLTELLYDHWPELLNKKCHKIAAITTDGQQAYDLTTRQAFENGFREHHSLDDAKVMTAAFKAMRVADSKAPPSQNIMNMDILKLINNKIPRK